MKKNIAIAFLAFALIFSIIISNNRQNLLQTLNQDYDERVSDYEMEVMHLKKENNEITAKQELIEDEANSQLESYEELLRRWLSYSDENTYEMLNKLYDVKAIIHTDNRSFEIPQNGVVKIDSSYFALEIELNRPPILRDVEINKKIHLYGNVIDNIMYDKADEILTRNDYIYLRYNNLKHGDKISFRLFNELCTLLELSTPSLEVVVTDEFPKGNEYFPQKDIKKSFTGGYENSGYTEIYEFVSDDTCLVRIEEAGANIIYKYDINKGVAITEISRDDNDFEVYERVILPDVIRIGEKWTDLNRVATITAIDVPIQTIVGEIETIEVTYNINGKIGEYDEIIYNYAKGLGVVYKRVYGIEGILLRLE